MPTLVDNVKKLLKAVAVEEEARETAKKKSKEIVEFLTLAYEHYRETIDEKAIRFFESRYIGDKKMGEEMRCHFILGEPKFNTTFKKKFKVELYYSNPVWKELDSEYYRRDNLPSLIRNPKFGKEYLENVRPELKAFAQDIGADVLVAHDPFHNSIEIRIK